MTNVPDYRRSSTAAHPLLWLASIAACGATGQNEGGAGDDTLGSVSGSTAHVLTDSEPGTAGSAGTGSGDTGSNASPLCDGSDHIRIIETVPAPLPNDVTYNPAQAVMYENGFDYFYVTGMCEFRVVGDRDVFAPDIVGTLDESQASLLAAALHFSEWPGFYDQAPGFWPTLNNAILLDQTGRLIVGAKCFPDDLDLDGCPAPFPEIASGITAWRETLRAGGQPADGPMRVAAVIEEPPSDTPEGVDWEPWPLERPLSDFLLAPDAPIAAGQAALLEDPAETTTMREFRAAFVAQFEPLVPGDSFRGMYVLDQGQHYLVYARDAAEIEDEAGLIPWFDRLESGM